MAGPASAPVHPKLRRISQLAWLLDRSIPIGGGRRIGLDPILGLVPGGGDALGTVLGAYVIFEAARLDVPMLVLLRMIGNLAIDGIVGTVPLLGDLFDAAWQANIRNVRLVERHARPDRPNSANPVLRLGALVGILLLLVGAIIALNVWVFVWLVAQVGQAFAS